MKLRMNRAVLFLVYLVSVPFVALYRKTCRIHCEGPLLDFLNGGKPFLMTWWHQDMLFNYSFITRWIPARRFISMTSRSEDGEIAGYLLIKYKFKLVRGSSSRGGSSALGGMIEELSRGEASGILVADGPRPPAREAKIGIVALARETGLPIIAMRSWADRQWIFRKSWPKLAFVLPFAAVRILSSGPITVPREAGKETLEKYRKRVEDELNRLADESERPFD